MEFACTMHAVGHGCRQYKPNQATHGVHACMHGHLCSQTRTDMHAQPHNGATACTCTHMHTYATAYMFAYHMHTHTPVVVVVWFSRLITNVPSTCSAMGFVPSAATTSILYVSAMGLSKGGAVPNSTARAGLLLLLLSCTTTSDSHGGRSGKPEACALRMRPPGGGVSCARKNRPATAGLSTKGVNVCARIGADDSASSASDSSRGDAMVQACPIQP